MENVVHLNWQIDPAALVGSFGTIVVTVFLYWHQRKSATEQQILSQRAVDESAARQVVFAQALADKAVQRHEAVKILAEINRHCQRFVYAFRNCHPENIPSTQAGATNPLEPSYGFSDPHVKHERAAALLEVVTDLNTDKAILGAVMERSQEAIDTCKLIDELIHQSFCLLDETFTPEMRRAEQHFEINSSIVGRIGKSLNPIYDSLFKTQKMGRV